MSASREKKQRQGTGSAPSQKSVRAQQEQAALKRQTIIYTITGVVIAALVIALLVWRSGFFQSRAAAAQVGDETLSTAELSYYYYAARQTTAYYASLGMGSFDTSKADDAQVYNAESGQTYRDYFLEQALDTAQQMLARSKQAAANGHTEAEVKAALDAEISEVKTDAGTYGYSYSSYLKAIYGNYMTPSIYEKLYTRNLMASLAATDQYNEFFDGYSKTELDAYYAEHADDLDTVEYSYLYFAVPSVDTKDADGNELAEDEVEKLKEDAKAETRAKAEEALEAVEGGSSFESQITKYELSTSTSQDHATIVGPSGINSNYRDDLLALDKDECKLVETDNGYYVVAFHDRRLVEDPTRDVRHILVLAETTTEEHEDHEHTAAPTDEAWAAAKAKMDEIQAAWESSSKTEDDFAKLADENSDDGDGTTGGLYERSPEGRFVPEFNEWVFDPSRAPGDVGLVQHVGQESDSNPYYGYHLIYYVGENEPAWMGSARDAMADEALEAWNTDLCSAYATSLSGGADYLGK